MRNSPMTTDPDLTALHDRLVARARHLTGDRDLAQDLAQDAILKLWQAQVAGRQIDDAGAYAMTILRHLVASRWRRRVIDEPLDESSLTTQPHGLARLGLAKTRLAIDRLPPDQADLMRYVADGDTSPGDLASRTGLPPGTVMSRLARARARLRHDLNLPERDAVDSLV